MKIVLSPTRQGITGGRGGFVTPLFLFFVVPALDTARGSRGRSPRLAGRLVGESSGSRENRAGLAAVSRAALGNVLAHGTSSW